MAWSPLIFFVVIAGFLVATNPNLGLIEQAQQADSAQSEAPPNDNIVQDIDVLVQGVGFDVLVVSQRWGLVPTFCVGFKSQIDRTFETTQQLSDAFEEAKLRLDSAYPWYDVWGNVQFGILSTLYYIGWSTTWLFSYLGMSLSAVEFYLLPLPSIYITTVPKQERFEYVPNEPSALYIYLEELGYELIRLSESIGVTGPELVMVFRTSDKPEVVRQWAWAKIDTFMESYEPKVSLTYMTMSAFLYLLRRADESLRNLGDDPTVDLDFVSINVGLLPFILNRFSMRDTEAAVFVRNPCQ